MNLIRDIRNGCVILKKKTGRNLKRETREKEGELPREKELLGAFGLRIRAFNEVQTRVTRFMFVECRSLVEL